MLNIKPDMNSIILLISLLLAYLVIVRAIGGLLNKLNHNINVVFQYLIITVVNVAISIEGYSLFETILINFMLFIIVSMSAVIGSPHDHIPNQYLRRTDLFFFKYCEWIFSTRAYAYLGYILILIFVAHIFDLLVHSNTYSIMPKIFLMLSFFFLLGFLLRHLRKDASDKFQFTNFEETAYIFNEKVSNFNQKYEIKNDKTKRSIDKDINLINLMGFVVFMEDKDFFSRRKLFFSPKAVKRRKNSYSDIVKEQHSNVPKIRVRGYSTIPQQLVRRIALKQKAYAKETTFRRKIFIEHIYMVNFFEYFKLIRHQYVKKFGEKKEWYSESFYKVEILKAYMYEVHGVINNKDDLIKSMARNSKIIVSHYHNQFAFYQSSEIKHKYSEIIAAEYYRWYHKGRMFENKNRIEKLQAMMNN